MRRVERPILIVTLVLTIIGNSLFPVTTMGCTNDPPIADTNGIIEDFDGHSLVSSWSMDDKSKPFAYDMDFSFPAPPDGSNGNALKVGYDRTIDDNSGYGAFIIEGLFDLTEYDRFSFRVYNDGSPLKFNIRLEDSAGESQESDWIIPGDTPGKLQKYQSGWETLSFNFTKEVYYPTNPAFDWTKIVRIKFMVHPGAGTGAGTFWIDDIRVDRFPNKAPLQDFEIDLGGWSNDPGNPFDITQANTSETGAASPVESQKCMKVTWTDKQQQYNCFDYNTLHLSQYNNGQYGNIPQYRIGNFPMNVIYQGNNKIDVYFQSPTECTVPVIFKVGATEFKPVSSTYVSVSGNVANINFSCRNWVKVTWTIPTSIEPAENKYKIYIFLLANQADTGGTIYIDDMFIYNGTQREAPTPPTDVTADNANQLLTWSAVSGASEYRVLKSADKTFANAEIIDTTDTFVNLPAGSASGDTYFYCVKAKQNNHYGTYSKIIKYNPVLSDEQLLDLESWKSFRYFIEQADPNTGLIKHMYREGGNIDFSRTGSAGYALSAYVIGAQKGWLTNEEAQILCNRLLDTLLMMQSDPETVYGALIDFVDVTTGHRKPADNYALPNLFETSKAVCGALTAGEFFGGDIKRKAEELYAKVQWNEFLDTRETREYDHVNHPGEFIENYYKNMFYKVYCPSYCPLNNDPNNTDKPFGEHWDFNGEQLMIYLLAAGAPNPVYRVADTAVWDKFQKRLAPSMVVGTYEMKSLPVFYTFFGNLSGYQVTQGWFNFKDMIDNDGVNWHENSVNAILANRQYCIDQSSKFSTYTADSWGLTNCQEPFSWEIRMYGAHPMKFDDVKLKDYEGDVNNHNGTVSPPGAVSSMPFAPEYSIKAMQNFYNNYKDTFGKYGFVNAFNANVNNADGVKLHGNTWYTNEWYSDTVFDWDKGMELLAIENYEGGKVWNYFMKNRFVQAGLSYYGFKSVNDAIVDDFDGNKRTVGWADDGGGCYTLNTESIGLDAGYYETGTVYNGRNSLKVDFNKGCSTDACFYADIKDPGCFKLADTFRFRLYYQGDISIKAELETSCGSLEGSFNLSGLTGWTDVECDVSMIADSISDANRLKFTVFPGTSGVSGTLYIDDIRFEYSYPCLESGKAASASTETAGYPVSNAIDDNGGTKWQSTSGNDQWLTVDMGSSVIANTFVVEHAGSNGENEACNTKKYIIQISEDNNYWVDLVWVDNNTCNVTASTLLNPVIARYYRLKILEPVQSGTGTANIYGFHIYNRDSLYKEGLESRSMPCAPDEDPLVLEWLKKIQDTTTAEQKVIPSQEDFSAQTFNNALAAMAFIAEGDDDSKGRAERILDFYSDPLTTMDQNNTDESKQCFYYTNPDGVLIKGFYQEMRLRDESPDKPKYATGLSDRWIGDNAWLLIALKYYEKEYTLDSKPQYRTLINAIRDLIIEYYEPVSEDKGFIQSGWRWGPKNLREMENLTEEQRLQLANNTELHEFDSSGNPVGREEGNIDCYSALILCGDAASVSIANKIKLWIDDRITYYETEVGRMSLDLYTWRSMAFGDLGQYYKDLAQYPDINPLFKRVALFNNERAIALTSSPYIDNQNPWMDALGHEACALYAAGDTNKANFYTAQYKAFLIDRVIGGANVKAIPYMANRTGGFDWVKLDKGFVSAVAWYIFAQHRLNPFTLETY